MPSNGSYARTIICKGTFTLRQGRAELSEVQDFVNDEDNHWNDDPQRSLYSASDMVPFKRCVDVLLVGDAFSATGPTHSLVARIIVGSVEKNLEVHADRHFDQQGELKTGERFSRMSLRYERAPGGPQTRNPVGIDPQGARDLYGRLNLPNLQPVGTALMRPGEPIAPIGFGPIAAHWPGRRALAGTSGWDDGSQGRPFPTDLDGNYFNVAPHDQRLDVLAADERLVLDNLHPEHAQLICNLPNLQPVIYADLRAGHPQQLAAVADTLWIDTQRGVFTVVWRARLDLKRANEKGVVLVAMSSVDRHLSFVDVRRLAGGETGKKRTKARTVSSDELTSIGVMLGASSKLPSFMAAAGAPAKPRVDAPTGGQRRTRHQEDHSPNWVGAESEAAPAQDPLASTLGYGMMSPWAKMGAHQQPTPMALGSASATPTASPSGIHPAAHGSLNAPMAPAPRPPAPPSHPLSTGAPSSTSGVSSVTGGVMAAPEPIRQTPQMPSLPQAPVRPPNPVASALVRPPNPMAAARPAPPKAVKEPAEPKAKNKPQYRPTEIVQLLWFDPEVPDNVREQEAWRNLLAKEAPEPPDPLDFDAEPEPEEPPELRDKRDIVTVLTRGHSTSDENLARTMFEAVDDTGNFIPPLIVMSGVMLLPFDTLEILKATLAAVTPLVANNKELKETVDAIEELMGTPWLQEGSSEVAEGLTKKVRDAFKKGDRMLDPDYLDNHTNRVLLEQRRYQKRVVLGKAWIRGLLTPTGSKAKVPCYLPEELSNELPMFQSFAARLIAEAHVQQDQYETHQNALKVVALGRKVELSKAGVLR